MRIAVVDSSPLINLTHLNLSAKLSVFFDVVFVPMAVQREVNRVARFRYRLNRLYERSIFQRCSVADEWNKKLLMDELDEGEAEALTQGPERAARFFIADEKRAREIGRNKGLKPVGTVRLLARLHLEGHGLDPKVLVRKLRRDLRFRISDRVVDEAIAAASEPI